MKSTGIVRKIDQLGRIVLPKELRNILDLPESTPMEIYVDGEQIIIRRYAPDCIFCGDTEGIKKYKGKNVCKTCLKDLEEIK